MDKPAEYFTAYYIEYPDKGIATIVECRKEGPEIHTADPHSREMWLATLRERAVEVVAFTSHWEDIGSESGRQYRRWSAIEPEAVAS